MVLELWVAVQSWVYRVYTSGERTMPWGRPVLSEGGRAETLEVGEYLEISGIMRTQAGRYECKASNDVATPDVKYVNVVVNYPPLIKDAKSSEIPVGRPGILQCDATAVPKPEFEWYRDDK
ncbi:hypothetical protein NFI96_013920, partial [Prochilodus magdalenae]